MTDLLLLAFVFLFASVVVVPIATRFALGSVLGYLLAGIFIGPLLSLLDVNVEAIQHVAEFGVVMMLFLVGLELEPKHLWSMRHRLLGLGGGQVVLTTLAVMLAAMSLGQPWTISLAIGFILSLSSTAIVIQTLTEKGLMKSDGGQSSFSVLLTQDIAVIPILIILPLLAIPELQELVAHSGGVEAHQELSLVEGLSSWQAALVTVIAIALVVFVGSVLTAPVFRFIAAARLRELFTATALMFVVAIALLMSLVDLSPALGTFLAGVVLANSVFRHELESNIEPVKGLLLGLFFMTVGAGVDFKLLMDQFSTILMLTIGLFLIKALVLLVLAVIFKIRSSDKWLLALGLAQAGEFAFVLLSFTVSSGVIPDELADKLLLVVALSMLLSPGLFILYERVVVRLYLARQRPEPAKTEMPDGAKVIVAGAGRVGGLVDRMMRAAGFETTVIDFSIERLNALERFQFRSYFGDATRPDLLRAAGLNDAGLLVVALDDAEQISRLVQYVIKYHPKVHVIARAVDRHHVYDLWAYGCRDIIRETYDSTLRMGRSAYEALGISRETAEKMIEVFHKDDKEVMIELANVYKVGVPAHENDIYVQRMLEIKEERESKLYSVVQKLRASDSN